MSITRKLADFLAQVSYESLPPSTREKVRFCLIDYLGSAWNALPDPLTETYRTLCLNLGGSGSIPIIGGGATTPAFAAMANGAIGHIKEVDDLQRTSTMHVAITVFPALFAAAFGKKLQPKRFIEAVVCGYETAIRVGETLGREHYAIFHTTGTAGTFAAAAAVAKYLGLNAEQIADALGHAGTQAASLWQFLVDGALATKPLHPGKAAMNGYISAHMAQAGIKGAAHILEGEKGFGRIAAPGAKLERIVEGLGEGFKIEQICFKNYPCCGQTHSMLDALKQIMAENNLCGDDIVEVCARVYRQALDLTSNPDPKNLSEARFSLPLCMGTVLAKGDLNFSDMCPQILEDQEIRRQSKKLTMVYDPEIDSLFPKTRPCLIIVRDRNGQEYQCKNLYRRGDPEKPMTIEDVRRKFISLTGGILSQESQKRILNWAEHLDEQESLLKIVFDGCVQADGA